METISIQRICWSFGHKTKQAAWDSAYDDMAESLMSESDRPEVKSYRNKNHELRFAVYIEAGIESGF